MNQFRESSDTMWQEAVVRALESAADPLIPGDFAARVRSALPAAPTPHSVRRVGPVTAATTAVLLLLALFALAPLCRPHLVNFAFDLELLLLAQLAAIAYWLASRRAL